MGWQWNALRPAHWRLMVCGGYPNPQKPQWENEIGASSQTTMDCMIL
jgi:hypothetical protein